MSQDAHNPNELPWSGERFVPQIAGNIRLEHLHRYLLAREYCRGRVVLDIACGEGYGSALLAGVAARVIGVDLAPDAIAHARQRYSYPNLQFTLGNCGAIPLRDQSVDVVVSFETIEHHDQHDAMLRDVKRVLAPGGTLIISSPDKHEYSDVPAYRNPFHIRELYRREFEDLLGAHFRHVSLAGQRVKAGSLIWPLEAEGRRFSGYEAGASADDVRALGAPLYLIAAASDEPVPPLPSGLLDGGEFVWSTDHVNAFQTAETQYQAHFQRLNDARARAETATEDALAQLKSSVTARDAERSRIELALGEASGRLRQIEASYSWRLTAPLRSLRRALQRGQPLLRTIRDAALEMYRALPLTVATRLKIKDALFRALPFLFRRTSSYRAWEAYRRTTRVLQKPSLASGGRLRADGSLPEWFYADAGNEYVPIAPSAGVDTRIKAVAFYLPQFHPIPENDTWWGKGFTEWTNVSRGKPQFAGHYQPHLPGELGFYDLRIPDVQRRQIELAKMYGLHGFCYHFYWFAGKRLLRQPLDQLMANPDMDFPFCLCWANENWTRRWDGEESEILIGQQYSPDDDRAFIQEIAPMLRDPRYIRVDGRPVLVVYRPALLPDASATAERWRSYCRENGLGELYLISTHAFDRVDPREFGFDAAMEFAPNNLGPPAAPETVTALNPDFRGTIYDYQYLVEHSRTYEASPFTLFRSVTPMWDNEARRPGRSTVFAHSSPARYQEMLENACRHTDQRFDPEHRFVFVNAWNEWAEGAHLEPDRRYGYAYLQATANALRRFPSVRHRAPIVVVSHDAYFHGAQRVALTLTRTLTEQLGYDVEILLCGPGPLRPEFERYGRVHDFFSPESTDAARRATIRELYAAGARIALCNTSVVGSTVELLAEAGFSIVSMVHELPGLIKQHGLESSITAIARSADRVVFPAKIVRDRYLELTGMPPSRAVVRPQGLLAANQYKGRRGTARQLLRNQLRTKADTIIALGMGYADRRKGLDLFVEVGLAALDRIPNLLMVWVGHSEAQTLAEAQARITERNAGDRFLFPGLVEEPDLFFAGADIYLMTSREDPFPLVVLHALDAEIPVIGFEGAGGFVELLSRGCGSLVPYLDTAAMATAIERLLTRSDEREQLVATGRSIIDREFDFSSYARFLVDLADRDRLKVSVIVPNYNYARHLTTRIHSILAQTYQPHEIIFLDDCSSDGSVDLAERLLGQGSIPYRIIRNETNQGCYRQWLKGLREATGDLVWIAEADDDCAPELLELLVPAFRRSDVVLAYCQSRQIDDDGREIAPDYLAWTADISATKWRTPYVRRGIDEIRDTLIIKNSIPNVSGLLLRKPDLAAIETLLVTLRNAGDWLTYAHLLERGDIAYFPTALNFHRRHRGSLTIGKGGLNLMQEMLQVQQWIKARHAISPDVELKRIAALQITYEYLQLHVGGPESYQDHEGLRPLPSTTAG